MYSIESFINYVYEDDNDYATEGIGIIDNALQWIKKQLKRLKEFLFKTIPLKLKSFLDKHPDLKNKPVIKSIYNKLKKLESKTKDTENKIKKNENLITKQSDYSQGNKQKEVINEIKNDVKDLNEGAKEVKKDVIDALKLENSDYTNMTYTATPDDVNKNKKELNDDINKEVPIKKINGERDNKKKESSKSKEQIESAKDKLIKTVISQANDYTKESIDDLESRYEGFIKKIKRNEENKKSVNKYVDYLIKRYNNNKEIDYKYALRFIEKLKKTYDEYGIQSDFYTTTLFSIFQNKYKTVKESLEKYITLIKRSCK